MVVAQFEERAKLAQQKFYLTTAIAYLNGPPHIGHAYEFATGDVIARYHEVAGRKTLFVTGSDEHGQKVENTALAHKMSPLEWCDQVVTKFQSLNEKLDLMPHVYVRTSADSHTAYAQWLWTRCHARGDIYKGSYKGWYNVKEETFVTDREAEAHGYKCPDTGVQYEQRHEEAYFFRMSKYHKEIEALLKSDHFVQPESRRNELLQRLSKAELEDLCVSRSTLKWGVPVPNDPEHVMYVWFDALTSYMSALSLAKSVASDDPDQSSVGTQTPDRAPIKPENFEKFWPADCHLIGKDIIWFHCVIWPSMLMSAELPLPYCVYGHGFVQAADGQKMSKTLGNTLSPLETLEKVTSDTFRYYIIREGTYGNDMRFNQSALIDMHNSDLCCVIGNLVHRVIALGCQSCEGKVPTTPPLKDVFDLKSVFEKGEAVMAKYALEEFACIGLDICKEVNKFLTEEAPWKLKLAPAAEGVKAVDGAAEMTPANRAIVEKKQAIIRSALEAVYVAAHYLWPVIPAAAEQIFERLGQPKKHLWQLQPSANLEPGRVLHQAKDVLFTQIQ